MATSHPIDVLVRRAEGHVPVTSGDAPVCINLDEFRQCSRHRESDGGEVSLDSAFAAIRIRPRVLVDVSAVDMTQTLLSRRVRGPIGAIVDVRTNNAQTVAAVAALTDANSASAVVLIRNSSPAVAATALENAGTSEWCQRWYELPSASRSVIPEALPRLTAANVSAVVLRVNSSDTSAWSWQDAQWIISHSSRLLATVVHIGGDVSASVVRCALAVGVSGIIVTSVDALTVAAQVVAATPQCQCALCFEGEVLRGTDVYKLLALGADVVLLRRILDWGYDHSGRAGIQTAFEILRSEVELTMALAGTPNTRDIDARRITTTRALIQATNEAMAVSTAQRHKL